ncbi:unnamed protein product [Symbiodinium sp. KB8]|nr:unnamed protein product [Symbiodinium sp. KB8]
MAAPSLPTIPEVQYENLTGEHLAADLPPVLTGRTVDEIKNEGRTDLVRLATGETFVRPTAFTRVIPDTAGVLVVNAGNDGPDESQNGNLAVDAAIGIRPRPSTAPSVAAATVSTATGKGVGKNGTPAEALHVMNGMLVHYRLSRILQRLDEFVTTDSHVECDKIVVEAAVIADRLYNAQVGLAEAVYRVEEWQDADLSMTRAERMFLTKGNWHIEWKYSPNAKENVTHDLVNVYDWVMLPASVGEKFYQNGVIDLSQFPGHQLNGSFNALSAMRKTVQWFLSKMEAHRQWVEASNGKMKLDNYFNRQFTDHISTQNGVPDTTEVPSGVANVPKKWIWTVPEASLKSGHHQNALE